MLIIAFVAGTAWSQESEEEKELSRVEINGSYSLLRKDGKNLNGWKAGAAFNVNRWFAVAVDGDGHYFSESTPNGTLNESEHSITAGPHFAYRSKSKVVPFTYAMAGVAFKSESIGTESETKTGFAFETGGGFDWEVSRRFSIRVIDVTASVTRIGGHTAVEPKFSTGVVFHFGRK